MLWLIVKQVWSHHPDQWCPSLTDTSPGLNVLMSFSEKARNGITAHAKLHTVDVCHDLLKLLIANVYDIGIPWNGASVIEQKSETIFIWKYEKKL